MQNGDVVKTFRHARAKKLIRRYATGGADLRIPTRREKNISGYRHG